jgi:peptidoglycan/xylan/chitin deacetylase (PgdA/CDA1 family)
MYLIKTPWWLRALYPSLVWRIKGSDKTIYLTFDDGPHPTATPFVLDELKKYNAKASFFCIGKNVAEHPAIYQRIIDEGHAVGNHTYHHLNGWKTSDEVYLGDIKKAAALIDSPLFRPPYGRIKRSQLKKLQTPSREFGTRLQTVVMWDVLSADFDTNLTADACSGYVLYHTKPGSIVLFHDSEKAFPRMKEALPKMLEYFTREGYRFEAIEYRIP